VRGDLRPGAGSVLPGSQLVIGIRLVTRSPILRREYLKALPKVVPPENSEPLMTAPG
jgi:hypothetical protein